MTKPAKPRPMPVYLVLRRLVDPATGKEVAAFVLLRIGAEKVAWIEGPHEARKYTVEEIKAIKADYRAKTKELKKGQAA